MGAKCSKCKNARFQTVRTDGRLKPEKKYCGVCNLTKKDITQNTMCEYFVEVE